MKISLFLLVAVFTSFIDGKHFRNDYVYMPAVNGWMKLHKIQANWHDARLRCHYEGSVLASPQTIEMYAAMTSTSTSGSGIFSGFSAAYSGGQFLSVEGAPMGSEMLQIWSETGPSGERDDDGHKLCVTMIPNVLHAVRCDQPRPYVCYRNSSLASPPADTRCGTHDPEYVFEEKTGHCYKFHRFGQSWARAATACGAEGGHLAVINSDEEAQLLRNLTSRYPLKDIIAQRKEYIAVGFRDWSEHSIWMTVHGQSLEQAGYARWQPGEPNDAGAGEDCGCIDRAAALYDIACDHVIPFICEKSPASLLGAHRDSQQPFKDY